VHTIIAGSRSITSFLLVREVILASGFDITEVISGDAPGVDWCGAYYGYLNNIPVKHFPAQWKYHGKAAGPIRNQVMADYAKITGNGALIAIHNGNSKGTRDMISKAKRANLERYICIL